MIRRLVLSGRVTASQRCFIATSRFNLQPPANHSLIFRSFTALPRDGSWSSLPESQRSAWELLGWDEDRWEGRRAPPPSSLSSWDELSSAEQAAAKYGLGYTEQSWDENVTEGDWLVDNDGQSSLQNKADDSMKAPATYKSARTAPAVFGNEDKDSSVSTGGLRGAVTNFVKGAAKVLAPTMVDNITEPVVVDGVETTLYLDDSPSMNETMGGGWFGGPTRLEEAKKVVNSISPSLRSLPCRVLKFSNHPTVLALREDDGGKSSNALALRKDGASSTVPSLPLNGWNASGNGTYLWHMIQEDVMKRYRPGTGKLRLVVVTDGDDNMSPAGYQGMNGMNPMMRTLQDAGYDIEWHIVVIGDEKGLERYKDLAGATGGSFLALTDSFDENSRDAKQFVDAVKSSGRAEDDKRRERQRQYELDRKKGRAEPFDWYKALPPGGNK